MLEISVDFLEAFGGGVETLFVDVTVGAVDKISCGGADADKMLFIDAKCTLVDCLEEVEVATFSLAIYFKA